MTWWPVILLLLGAPFVVHGWHSLEVERVRHAHSRDVARLSDEVERTRRASFEAGRLAGVAEVRASELAEVEKTRQAMAELEAELAAAQAAQESTSHPPVTPADILLLCKRSASCRERGGLK